MKSYFELRHQLAQTYLTEADWSRAARDIGLDPSAIVLQGTSITAWSNIFEEIRKTRRVDGLREFLTRNESHLLPLFNDSASVLASAATYPLTLPDLESITLAEEDIDPDSVGRSLASARPLSEDLLRVTLQNEPNVGAIDSILSGDNTAAAKRQLADFKSQLAATLSRLSSQRQEAANGMSRTESRIRAIESASPPSVPVAPAPNYTLSAADQDNQRRYHEQRMASYQSALTTYQAGRSELGSLKSTRDAQARDRRDIEARIDEAQTNGRVGELQFEKAITEARDRDLLRELDLALEKTNAAFREENPFKGFWALLGASALLDLIAASATQAGTKTEARGRFESAGAAFAQLIENGQGEIAPRCLAAPICISRLSAASRTAIEALRDRLADLPSAQMEERRRQEQDLLDTPLAPVLDFSDKETQADLEATRRQLGEALGTTRATLDAVRATIATEPAALKAAIEAAQADAGATVAGIEALAKRNAAMLADATTLWALIQKGAGSMNLPATARRLCEAMPPESERRADAKVITIIDTANDTRLGTKSAQAMMKTHLLTRYVDAQAMLRTRIDALDARRGELEQAIKDIDKRYEQVAYEVRGRLHLLVGLSILPGIGLIAAMSGAQLVGRLSKLIPSSTVAPYVALTGYAPAALAWGAIVAVLPATLMSVLAFYLYYWGHSPDAAEQATMLLLLAVASVAALALSIRNLLRLRAHLRPRRLQP